MKKLLLAVAVSALSLFAFAGQDDSSNPWPENATAAAINVAEAACASSGGTESISGVIGPGAPWMVTITATCNNLTTSFASFVVPNQSGDPEPNPCSDQATCEDDEVEDWACNDNFEGYSRDENQPSIYTTGSCTINCCSNAACDQPARLVYRCQQSGLIGFDIKLN